MPPPALPSSFLLLLSFSAHTHTYTHTHAPSDHPVFLRFVTQLADLYRATGELQNAEPLYLLIMQTRQETGVHHWSPSHAARCINLALLFRHFEQLDRSRGLLVDALAIIDTKHGNSHVDFAGASTHLAQVMLDMAEKMPPGEEKREKLQEAETQARTAINSWHAVRRVRREGVEDARAKLWERLEQEEYEATLVGHDGGKSVLAAGWDVHYDDGGGENTHAFLSGDRDTVHDMEEHYGDGRHGNTNASGNTEYALQLRAYSILIWTLARRHRHDEALLIAETARERLFLDNRGKFHANIPVMSCCYLEAALDAQHFSSHDMLTTVSEHTEEYVVGVEGAEGVPAKKSITTTAAATAAGPVDKAVVVVSLLTHGHDDIFMWVSRPEDEDEFLANDDDDYDDSDSELMTFVRVNARKTLARAGMASMEDLIQRTRSLMGVRSTSHEQARDWYDLDDEERQLLEEPREREKQRRECKTLLSALYDLLIRPLLSWLPSPAHKGSVFDSHLVDTNCTLVFVPHGYLWMCPWPALYCHESRMHLVEQFALRLSPSIMSLGVSSKQAVAATSVAATDTTAAAAAASTPFSSFSDHNVNKSGTENTHIVVGRSTTISGGEQDTDSVADNGIAGISSKECDGESKKEAPGHAWVAPLEAAQKEVRGAIGHMGRNRGVPPAMLLDRDGKASRAALLSAVSELDGTGPCRIVHVACPGLLQSPPSLLLASSGSGGGDTTTTGTGEDDLITSLYPMYNNRAAVQEGEGAGKEDCCTIDLLALTGFSTPFLQGAASLSKKERLQLEETPHDFQRRVIFDPVEKAVVESAEDDGREEDGVSIRWRDVEKI